MFEVATKEKFRFPFNGNISTEDLWDLTPEQLDTVYKKLAADAKRFSEDSLVAKKSKDEKTLAQKIEVVKHIFECKQAEIVARKERIANREKRQRLQALIAEKQDAALKDMAIDDLKKMLDELGD